MNNAREEGWGGKTKGRDVKVRGWRVNREEEKRSYDS